MQPLDLKAYIESGILEQYVLGQLSPAEQRAVEAIADQHAEVREEIDQIELTLESFAQAGAIPPPAGTLDQINRRINNLDSSIQTAPSQSIGWTRWLIAASILLAWGCIYLWMNNLRLSQDLDALATDNKGIQNCCDSSRQQVDSMNVLMAFLQDPSTRTVIMRGTDINPDALATVLFNIERQSAFVNLSKLSAAPIGKQYQLWALIDGQPIDMGVLPLSLARNQQLVAVPFLSTAGGFAVTLEPVGGSVVPTLESMVMVGMI